MKGAVDPSDTDLPSNSRMGFSNQTMGNGMQGRRSMCNYDPVQKTHSERSSGGRECLEHRRI